MQTKDLASYCPLHPLVHIVRSLRQSRQLFEISSREIGAPSSLPGVGGGFAKEVVSIHCPLSLSTIFYLLSTVNDKLEDYI